MRRLFWATFVASLTACAPQENVVRSSPPERLSDEVIAQSFVEIDRVFIEPKVWLAKCKEIVPEKAQENETAYLSWLQTQNDYRLRFEKVSAAAAADEFNLPNSKISVEKLHRLAEAKVTIELAAASTANGGKNLEKICSSFTKLPFLAPLRPAEAERMIVRVEQWHNEHLGAQAAQPAK